MIYVIYVAIDEGAHAEWERWLRGEHIPKAMETGCFLQGLLIKEPMTSTLNVPGKRSYRVMYIAKSAEHFDRYLDEHADQLRREHTNRYQGQFVARREVLHVIDRIEPPEE